MVFSGEGAMPAAEPGSEKANSNKREALRWAVIGGAAILVVIAALAVLFAIKWPFTKDRITRSFETTFDAKAEMASFHSTAFPHPGCTIEGLTLARPDQNERLGPLATAGKVTIRAAYLDLLLRPNFINRIVVENAHVEIPGSNAAENGDGQQNPQRDPQQSQQNEESNTRVQGELVANNSKLTIIRSDGKSHLDFDIHSLVLDSLGYDEVIGYRVEMTNSLPPGEISSHGRFGPWNTKDPKKTPLYGASVFERANLAAFQGIAGSLSSENEFEGALDSIDVHGNVDIPDFKVTRARDSVHLRAEFRARVDGTTGNVDLERVETSLLKTQIEAIGRIEQSHPEGARITSVDLSVHNGRIQDVIELFGQDKPPLDGRTNFRAHAVLHAFGEKFLKETELRGEFEIDDGRFTNPQRQAGLEELSARAQPHKPNGKYPEVTSEFHGDVLLKDGIARFTKLSMSVPAAAAQMNGMYNLLNDKIDFHGTLRTQSEISKQTRGIKAVLLKPLDPLFKKKKTGAVVPVQMTGTYDKPQFGIILASKGKPADTKQAPSK